MKQRESRLFSFTLIPARCFPVFPDPWGHSLVLSIFEPRGQVQDLEHRCVLKYSWLFECKHEQMSIFSRISGWNKHIVEIYFWANVSFELQMGHDDCLIYLSKDEVGSGVSHRPNFVVKHPNEASNS